MAEQKLTPTVSLSNSTEQGLFSLSVTYKGLFASVEYYQHVGNAAEMNKESTFVRFMNGSLDGHLGVYEWEEFDRFGWNEVADLFKEEIDECSYPTVCGKFGICSKGQKCRCPEPTIQGTTYFKQVIEKQPEIGCLEITPLSCNASQSQIFLEVKGTSYFGDLQGDCYLPPDIFSLKDSDNSGYHSVYLKVQNAPHAVPQGMKRGELVKILGSSIGSFFGLLFLIGISVLLARKRGNVDDVEEDYSEKKKTWSAY
ncbi:hypothetical protein NC653_029891 [Populus alba x Populus x berolinensis]|uniref:Uncharacterized protein n=1 Tax=Populus alba x Populus x berolinensis TaxID=444605 RepID=A0AAD6M3I4_9ROSI|nr:hypothetical protein NC653_029891 [Populus alba x Populus x berolinensis]